MQLPDLAGHKLGERTVSYTDADAILYALAVGAGPEQLDLVYERDLRVLPTYALALGLWAVEAAGELGAYDRRRSLHVGQQLDVKAPLPKEGSFTTVGRIASVWDKGKAALVEIELDSEHFAATYAIFLPGLGGWGGERGPATVREDELAPSWQVRRPTAPNAAALYRLTGDRHPVHIDPETAKANGFTRPILHGLCTLGIAAVELAGATSARPTDLQALSVRFAAPVLPGDELAITAQPIDERSVRFEARVGDTVVLAGGRATYGKSDAWTLTSPRDPR